MGFNSACKGLNWRKLQNKELHNVTSPGTVQVSKQGAKMDGGRDSEGKRTLRNVELGWEDNIKLGVKLIE